MNILYGNTVMHCRDHEKKVPIERKRLIPKGENDEHPLRNRR